MEARNHTQVAEFIFLGFSGVPHGQIYLFVLFLAIYLVTLIGNATIFTLIQVDSRLHSPMYFFLSHLSCLDVCYLSVTVPKILVNFLRQTNTISYNQCMAQMFFLMMFAGSECALLAIMSFDRYAAICQPLHYNTLMSSQVCVPLAVACWIWGFLDSSLHTTLATNLDFCGANHIDHIFCDVPPLLKIACSNTYVNELTLHLASIFMGLSPFLFILFSYMYIVSAILKIRSNTGRSKAFSTCAAHLVVVTIYFGMANVNYNRPSVGYSLGIDTLISTLYCILTPMLNPLIYSLRNKEVKEALQKLLSGLKTYYASNLSK
ncbi:olfactory receptor 5V1-like [Notechis scutatus]|uniref:Olfactory receptor n=1 Tax=Notechis scutatus TaxID=8663 RepID=A0A6J1W2W9_9SAUR|nr:olfactory receptor 5V1-like [Notechis scutatus]